MFSAALSLSKKFMLQRREVESQHSSGQDLRSCQIPRVGVCVISFCSADGIDFLLFSFENLRIFWPKDGITKQKVFYTLVTSLSLTAQQPVFICTQWMLTCWDSWISIFAAAAAFRIIGQAQIIAFTYWICIWYIFSSFFSVFQTQNLKQLLQPVPHLFQNPSLPKSSAQKPFFLQKESKTSLGIHL